MGADLYNALVGMYFLPSSPVLMNAGSPVPMLCSCFVLPVKDSIAEIMESLTNTVSIQKYGGGVGLNFSAIRPEGSRVNTTNGKASGPVSFMGFWNEAMNVIRQGGKRQGAMMGVLNFDHKDVHEFLIAKTVEGKLTNFNLSVGLTKEFFDDLAAGGNTMWPSNMTTTEIFNEIALQAWGNGEPGWLYLDNINAHNPYGVPIEATNPCWTGDTLVWTIDGPAPIKDLASKGEDVPVLTQLDTGELAFRRMRNPRFTGVSRVMAITLNNGAVLRATPNHKLVLKDGTKKEVKDLVYGDRLSSSHYDRSVRHNHLRYVVSVEFLDETEEVYNGTVDETHTYFVLTGDNDVILSSNCGEVPLPPYGACCLGSLNLSKFLHQTDSGYIFDFDMLRTYTANAVLYLNKVLDCTWWPLPKIWEFEMQYRPIGLGVMGLADVLACLGIPYASQQGREMASRIIGTMREEAEHTNHKYNLGNTTLLSVAPTGTIAMIADASYSIEPYFSLSSTKRTGLGVFVHEVSRVFDVADVFHYELTAKDRQSIRETGSIMSTNCPADMKEVLRTATEMSWNDHILMQAAVQSLVDNSVSKTINLPSETTVEEVGNILLLGHQLKLKGMTVYRNKSRAEEVIDCPTGTCAL